MVTSRRHRGWKWSTKDASNPTLVRVVDDTNKAVHVVDASDADADWAVDADSYPALYIHTAGTNVATDYIKMYHDDTDANIDAVGATALNLLIGGTSYIDLTTTALSPTTTDGMALGTTLLNWSDLFLDSGAVINWNNGEITMTHSATGKLAVAATWSTIGATGRPFSSNLTIGDVRLGSYANAFKAFLDCGASGGSTGVLSAANCEVDLPSTSSGEGVYCCNEHELVFPSGYNASGCIVSFMYFNTAGTDKADFDTTGYFFHIDSGLTAGASSVLSANSQTLKVGLGANAGTARYLVMSQTEDYLYLTRTETATGGYQVRGATTFTLRTTGVHKALSGEVTYTPATSGYATPIGVAGKVSLGSNFTGGTGYMWGVQGQLDLGTSHTINNASSVFAGVRGIISGTTPTFTDADEICCVYADNLCTTNMAGMSTGNSSLFRGHCTGGTMDNVLHVWASNNITNLFNFEACGGMISAGAATHSGTIKKIACLLDEVTYYLTISTAVS